MEVKIKCDDEECSHHVCPFEACVMATDKPNLSRSGCAAERGVFERDRKSSVVGRDMGLRVLVVCEFSGIVRDAFRAKGVDAWSCDLLPSESENEHHIIGDARNWMDNRWDILIAHPPCTHLAVSGARWFKDKRKEQKEAMDFVRAIFAAPIAKKCVENPVSIISSQIRKPDQIIQPWQFGHGETKTTCLWLEGLPKLMPTNIVEGREAKIHRMPPGADRWKNRSRTYAGIAQAMASQWSNPK